MVIVIVPLRADESINIIRSYDRLCQNYSIIYIVNINSSKFEQPKTSHPLPY